MESHPDEQNEPDRQPGAAPVERQMLPSMADLDRLTADLDAIDSTLAELDAK